MTDAELLAEVKRHWEHWAGHLGLENWHAKLVVKEDVSHNLSIEQVKGGYARVLIEVNPKPDWDGSMPPSWHVLHEAIHVHLEAMRDYAYRHSTLGTANREKSDFDEYHEAEERAADELAMSFWRLHEQTECGKLAENPAAHDGYFIGGADGV